MPVELEPDKAGRPGCLDLLVDDRAERGESPLNLASRGLNLDPLRACDEVAVVVRGARNGQRGCKNHATAAVADLLRGADAGTGERGLRDALAEVQHPGPAHRQDGQLGEQPLGLVNSGAVELRDARKSSANRWQREVLTEALGDLHGVEGAGDVPAAEPRVAAALRLHASEGATAGQLGAGR
eukprot:9172939-Pyramimonas_sp.AAC.1